jgi:hypothetical protein
VGALQAGEHALVVLGDHAREARERPRPLIEQALRMGAARRLDVAGDERAQRLGLGIDGVQALAETCVERILSQAAARSRTSRRPTLTCRKKPSKTP